MSMLSGVHLFSESNSWTVCHGPLRYKANQLAQIAVRVRPPLNPSDPGFDLIPQRFQRAMVHTTSNTSIAIDAPQGKKIFVFDRVFGPEVNQDGVWDYLNESINAFLQGYNVSLLAYGQSGAGKSYTMGTSGPLDESELDNIGKSRVVVNIATNDRWILFWLSFSGKG